MLSQLLYDNEKRDWYKLNDSEKKKKKSLLVAAVSTISYLIYALQHGGSDCFVHCSPHLVVVRHKPLLVLQVGPQSSLVI